MTIQELLGNDFKEGMTVDEISAALADKTLVDPSSLPKSVSKAVFDKTANELATAKKKIKEFEDANLSESEKIEQALKEAEAAKTAYEKKSVKLNVEKVFVTAGLTDEDYSSFIDGVVTTDSETSLANARAIVELVKNQRTNAENEVKKQIQSQMSLPKGDGKNEPSTKTMDEIMEIEDITERRAALEKYLTENDERN